MSSLPDQEIWKPKKMTDQSFLNQKLRRQWLSRSKLHPRVPNYCISFVTSTKSVTRLFLKVLTVKEMQECVHFSPWDSSKILCAWCEQGLIHSMLTYFNVDGGLLRRDATFEDYREKKSQFFFLLLSDSFVAGKTQSQWLCYCLKLNIRSNSPSAEHSYIQIIPVSRFMHLAQYTFS